MSYYRSNIEHLRSLAMAEALSDAEKKQFKKASDDAIKAWLLRKVDAYKKGDLPEQSQRSFTE